LTAAGLMEREGADGLLLRLTRAGRLLADQVGVLIIERSEK
jgi:hypothetical protein